VNGVPLALSVSSTLPAGITGAGRTVAVGGVNNQNRYAYGFVVDEWDCVEGDVQYHMLRTGGVHIAGSTFVTVESLITPSTSALDAVDTGVTYYRDPLQLHGLSGAVDQVILLPKSGLLLVNATPSIVGATWSGVSYNK
jgi:hypothetical protein